MITSRHITSRQRRPRRRSCKHHVQRTQQPHNATTQIKTQLPKTTNNKQRPKKKVVTTTIEPTRRAKGAAYDAYEYTARSHTYLSDATPAAKFTYDLSPIQVRSEGVCDLRARACDSRVCSCVELCVFVGLRACVTPSARTNEPNEQNRKKQIVVRERPRHYYHFLTTVCAVLGGVFTCAGILDAILYNGERFVKRRGLGIGWE